MPTLTVLDHTGDTKTSFDSADIASVKQAVRLFNEAMAKRHMAFAVDPADTQKKTQIRAFDPSVDIVMFPALMGG